MKIILCILIFWWHAVGVFAAPNAETSSSSGHPILKLRADYALPSDSGRLWIRISGGFEDVPVLARINRLAGPDSSLNVPEFFYFDLDIIGKENTITCNNWDDAVFPPPPTTWAPLSLSLTGPNLNAAMVVATHRLHRLVAQQRKLHPNELSGEQVDVRIRLPGAAFLNGEYKAVELVSNRIRLGRRSDPPVFLED